MRIFSVFIFVLVFSSAAFAQELDQKLAGRAVAVLKVESQEKAAVCEKYCSQKVKVLEVLKNDSDYVFPENIEVYFYSWEPGITSGQVIIYLEKYDPARNDLWKLMSEEAVTQENVAVDDHKPMDPRPALTLELVGFGCVTGFGGWVTPPPEAKVETACDQENLKKFQTVLTECHNNDTQSLAFMFDLDKDGCATCEDYSLWKKLIRGFYEKKVRSTSGAELLFEACDDKK